MSLKWTPISQKFGRSVGLAASNRKRTRNSKEGVRIWKITTNEFIKIWGIKIQSWKIIQKKHRLIRRRIQKIIDRTNRKTKKYFWKVQ